MMKIHSIAKSYNNKTVLKDVSFMVNKGEKIGLVGKNGTGKSTLLKIMAGKEKPDAGSIAFSREHTTVGYLAQSLSEKESQSLESFLLPGFRETKDDLKTLESQMASGNKKALKKYGEILEKFEGFGGFGAQSKAENTLNKLGIEKPLSTKISTLSGGQKSRLALTRELVKNPDIFLLDEPTNHLDMKALLWLESFIKSSKKTFIIISHDRRFLDRTISKIVEIKQNRRNIGEYTGNYTDYHKQKQKEAEKEWEEYEKAANEEKQLKKSIRQQKEWLGKKVKTKDKDKLIRGVARDQATRVNSTLKTLEKKLERLEKVDKPKSHWSISSRITLEKRGSDLALSLKNICKSWDEKTTLDNVSITVGFGERLAILGTNGSGKTTLLKILAGILKPDSGETKIGPSTQIGYFDQEQKNINLQNTIIKEFMNQSGMEEKDSRTFLHQVLFSGEDVFKKISTISSGERAKLIFAILMSQKPNCLLLDEPTNHLDVDSIEKIEKMIRDFPGTLITTTHDRYFLDMIGVRDFLLLENGVLNLFSGNINDYEAILNKQNI